MGKMKDLFMELQEAEANQQDVNNIVVQDPVYISETPCPNCLKSTLRQVSSIDYTCDSCCYDFIEVGKNRFRFRFR